MRTLVWILGAASALQPWCGAARQSRALQQELSRLSLREAARTLMARRFEANEVNVAAMLYKCVDESVDVVDPLLAAAREVVPQMQARQLANTMRAAGVWFGRGGSRELDATAGAVLRRVVEDAATWNRTEELSMTAWGAARAVGTHPELVKDALRALADGCSRVSLRPKEVAMVGWSLATVFEDGLEDGDVEPARLFLQGVVGRRFASPRDASTTAWACAKLGAADWRLEEDAVRALDAVVLSVDRSFFARAASQDVAQFAAAIGTGTYDDRQRLAAAQQFARFRRLSEREASSILWASAVLDRPPPLEALRALLDHEHESSPLELSLIIWAVAVLAYASPDHARVAADFVKRRSDALRSLDDPADLRRIHQALLALRVECDAATFETAKAAVDADTRADARAAWADESRKATSSGRHQAVSFTLRSLQTQHKVVATVRDEYGDLSVDMLVKRPNNDTLLAVEFDGPSHFCSNHKERPLGHTSLKRRLLAAHGFDFVSIPYFEWDSIPHWSSMERQRYLQRKLRITQTLRYLGGDSSSFAELPASRETRFD